MAFALGTAQNRRGNPERARQAIGAPSFSPCYGGCQTTGEGGS